ncbi:ribonucleoside-diphosphate reductase [Solimonas marina]|uniref:Ribonucleoside-diphosphate reductase n=1 Tax=Solimonas marina TaxID=2714601 RepID=A0A969W7N9_9GAMM|nr:ribonucleoside-diphosphate reductase [Solimonas marina]NKF21085.1 ribonucleoside-diphosphate reductase [Solimonas marina]
MSDDDAKAVKIDAKIVGWSVAPASPANDAPSDVDPLTLRIDRREEGSWESTTTKINLTSSTGSKTIYFVIGFGTVCGRRHGERICIERPLEFFIPAGQTAAEHQWVSATMRTLSLAARGGFLVKALADLRKVSWDRGPVWYGRSRSGKGMVHDSEVAAIAWAIEQELQRRGFLDERGEALPLDTLIANYERRQQLPASAPSEAHPVADVEAPFMALPGMLAERCPQCRGEMAMKDGCPTCLDCGWSKCG